ncbi:MAG: TIGR02281 family clan AA aspartic protease [Thermoplasmatota archaeon]
MTMVLDTGASITMIPSKVFAKIGYSPLKSEKRIKVHSENGPIDVNAITMEELDVYDAWVRDVEVICHDLPPESHVDGLIGLDFLKHYKMILDWPNGRLTIE